MELRKIVPGQHSYLCSASGVWDVDSVLRSALRLLPTLRLQPVKWNPSNRYTTRQKRKAAWSFIWPHQRKPRK